MPSDDSATLGGRVRKVIQKSRIVIKEAGNNAFYKLSENNGNGGCPEDCDILEKVKGIMEENIKLSHPPIAVFPTPSVKHCTECSVVSENPIEFTIINPVPVSKEKKPKPITVREDHFVLTNQELWSIILPGLQSKNKMEEENAVYWELRVDEFEEENERDKGDFIDERQVIIPMPEIKKSPLTITETTNLSPKVERLLDEIWRAE